MGKAFPYPACRGLVLCPVSAVGRRSVTLGQERPSEAFPCSVQGSDTPLRWSLLFAFSALAFVGSRSSQLRTQTRAGHRARRSCLRARPMDVQGLCTMGVMWPRIGLNASPLSEMVLEQKPHRTAISWGFGLCGAPIAWGHPKRKTAPKQCLRAALRKENTHLMLMQDRQTAVVLCVQPHQR